MLHHLSRCGPGCSRAVFKHVVGAFQADWLLVCDGSREEVIEEVASTEPSGKSQNPWTLVEYGKKPEITRADDHPDELDRKRLSARFAPKSLRMRCLWSKSPEFTEVIGNWNGEKPSEEGHTVDVHLFIGSGKRSEIPFVEIELDWARALLTKQQSESQELRPRDKQYGLRFDYQPVLKSQAKQFPQDKDSDVSADAEFEVQSIGIEVVDLKDPNSPFNNEDETEKTALKTSLERLMPKDSTVGTYLVKLTLFGGRCEQGWDISEFTGLAPAVRNMIQQTKSEKRPTVHYFMCQGYSDMGDWYVDTDLWWNEMYINNRLLPMTSCRRPDGSVDISLDEPKNVHTIFNGLYAIYKSDEEQMLQKQFDSQYDSDCDAANPPKVVFPNTPQGIYRFPFTPHFPDPRVCEAIMKLGILFEHQFITRELQAFFQRQQYAIGVKAFESYTLHAPRGSNKQPFGSNEERVAHTSVYLFIKMQRGHGGDESLTPPDGTQFYVDPTPEYGPYIPSDVNNQWKGMVIKHPDTHTLGAQFCIFARVPRNGRQIVIHKTMEHALAKSSKRRAVWLSPLFNLTTETRQFDALERVCDIGNTAMRHLQYPLFWNMESKGPAPVDYRFGNTNDFEVKKQMIYDWNVLCENIVKKYGYSTNPNHLKILQSFGSLQGSTTLLTGPAGTGKTSLQSNMHLLELAGNYKVFVTAEMQEAVDNDARNFYSTYQEVMDHLITDAPQLTERMRKKKFLRFEANGMPMAGEAINLLMKNSDPTYISKPSSSEMFYSDPRVIEYLELLASYDDAVEDDLKNENEAKLKAKVERAKLAYSAVDKLDTRRRLAYPRAMSMMEHLRLQREEDVANEKPQLSQAWYDLQLKRQHKEPLTKDELANFVKLRNAQMVRVIQSCDIVFLTLSASADPLIRDHIKPDFLYMEEATQISVPSACVGFQHMPKHTFLVGDLMQLSVSKASKQANPAIEYLNLSILQYMKGKGMPEMPSVIQYRVPPEVLDFITPNFYPSGLQAAECTKDQTAENHPARKAVRALSKQYNLVSPPSASPNFFMVDVPFGISIKEEFGHSRVNFAEAMTAKKVVIGLLEHGCPASDICLLAYYKGQVTLVKTMFGPEPRFDDIEVLTVDQSQGRTKPVCIVLTVSTAVPDVYKQFNRTPLEQDVQVRLSNFVLDPTRLNVALTRGNHGVIVLGCARTLSNPLSQPIKAGSTKPTSKQNDSKSGNALQALVAYHYGRDTLARSPEEDQNPRILQVLSLETIKWLREFNGRYKIKTSLDWLDVKKKEVLQRRTQEIERRMRNIKYRTITYNANSSGQTRIAPGQLADESEQRQVIGVPWGNKGKKAKKGRKDKGNGPDVTKDGQGEKKRGSEDSPEGSERPAKQNVKST